MGNDWYVGIKVGFIFIFLLFECNMDIFRIVVCLFFYSWKDDLGNFWVREFQCYRDDIILLVLFEILVIFEVFLSVVLLGYCNIFVKIENVLLFLEEWRKLVMIKRFLKIYIKIYKFCLKNLEEIWVVEFFINWVIYI